MRLAQKESERKIFKQKRMILDGNTEMHEGGALEKVNMCLNISKKLKYI